MFEQGVHRILAPNGKYIKNAADGAGNILWRQAKEKTVSGDFPLSFRPTRNKPLVDYKIKGTSEKAVTIGGVEYGVADNITLHESVANGSNAMVDTGVNCSDDMEFFCRFKCNTLDSLYLLQRRSTLNPSINGLTGSNNGAKIALVFCGQNVVSDITRTVGHIYAIKGTVLNGTLTLYVKDETTGTEDTKTGTYTVGTLPTDNVTMFGNAKNDSLASGNVVYEAYIKKNGSYAWYIIGDYDVIGKSVITATRGTLTAGKTTKTVVVEGQSIEVPLFHYRGVGDYGGKRNQLVRNGNFESTSGWSNDNVDFTVANNIATLVSMYSLSGIYQIFRDVLPGHKVLFSSDVKTTGTGYIETLLSSEIYFNNDGVWHNYSTIDVVGEYGLCAMSIKASSGIVYAQNSYVVDLTDTFGAGNEPTTVEEAKQKIAEVWNGGTPLPYYPYTEPTDYYDRHIVTSTGVEETHLADYHIYTDEQGFSCGDVADEVSFLGGDVLNIGHATLSEGTHSLTGAKSNGAYITSIPSSGTLTGTSITIPSGYGDVEVLYELATPVTKQIAAPTVQTQTGMMHFDVLTDTKTSGSVKCLAEI